MMFRAIVCCAALIIGLLAALNVTAQSAGACNGTACGSAQPLNLMNFMNGSAKGRSTPSVAAAAAKAGAGRHQHKVKSAARSPSQGTAASPESSAASSEPAALPATAATSYAAHSPDDVQVVSGEEVNAIDLAMSSGSGSVSETNGVSPGTAGDNGVKLSDANEFRAEQFKSSNPPAPANDTTGHSTLRDDSWIGRFWSAIGDGYVALTAMIKQLFS